MSLVNANLVAQRLAYIREQTGLRCPWPGTPRSCRRNCKTR